MRGKGGGGVSSYQTDAKTVCMKMSQIKNERATLSSKALLQWALFHKTTHFMKLLNSNEYTVNPLGNKSKPDCY